MSVTNSFTIYIGHQDPVVDQTLIEFLNDLGNQAAGFDSDADLRAKLALTDPQADVVITSLEFVSVGDVDSVALLQQMHQQHPTVALILITNGGRKLSASESASCGVIAFLREPIRLSELEHYLTRL